MPFRGLPMPENKVLDPFKPVQPHIPGVPSHDVKSKEDEMDPEEINQAPGSMGPRPSALDDSPRQLKLLWVGLTLAGALATVFFLFRGSHKPSVTPAGSSVEPPAATVHSAVPPPDGPPLDAKIPVGPGPIATTAELLKPWSAKRFYFRDPVSRKPVPAMVVHLPGGTFWGFSLREPYGECEMEFVADTRKLQQNYSFSATYPMIGDPCNKTVFDLTRYGNAPSGLVRGEIEQGPGWRPPMAIEIRIQDERIIAMRIEQ
jgi:hypothetical protein